MQFGLRPDQEKTRCKGSRAVQSSDLTMPRNQVRESVLPLVKYEEVEPYLELIGRQYDLNDIVVALFPPEQNKTCIHIPVNPSIPSHWGRCSVSWLGTRNTASASSWTRRSPSRMTGEKSRSITTASAACGSGAHPTTTSPTPS